MHGQVRISSESRFASTGRSSLEVYQAFMTGYVQRINEATLQVAVGGVRIGQARFTRLAQINLKSRVITFSRYAIENVPERGRRYLVIHELAHVKEPSHNKKFWEIVERFEPNYRAIGKAMELAFARNVKEEEMLSSNLKVENPLSGRLEQPKLLLLSTPVSMPQPAMQMDDLADSQDSFLCRQGEFARVGEEGSTVIAGAPFSYA